MLQKVIVQSSNPIEFDIESVDPDEILILKSISGLSKAGATLYTGEFAREGGYYQGRRAKPLTPVFNFKINPDYKNDIDASDIRDILYRQFLSPLADSDAVQVTVIDDRKPDRYFVVYTEDLESEMFEKELAAQVTTVSTEAYLRSVAETSGVNANGWFAFPVAYDGSADTGIEVTFKVLADTPSLVFRNNEDWIVLDGAFVTNDIITMNTTEGSRYIRLNGEDVMVLKRPGSSWITLKQSANVFQMFGVIPGDGKVVMTSYKFRSTWWGI